MDDYSDDDQPKRLIENQPYDETLEVPDGEDVASVYTPTPRHPKNNHHQQVLSQHQQQTKTQQPRPTPPPTSFSVSSGSNNDNQSYNPRQQAQSNQLSQSKGSKSNRMSESPSETPKPRSRGKNSSNSNNSHSENKNYKYDNPTNDLIAYSEQLLFEHQNNVDTDYLDYEKQYYHQAPKIKVRTPTSVVNSNDLLQQYQNTANEAENRNQNDMDDSGSEGNESGDDSQDNYNDLPGGYDPAAFRDLPVSPEIKDIFKFIERYQPQNIELDFKLKPFIPDYIPSIGDIDAFIKVPRPDGKQDNLGLTVVDEPSSNQSDPHVLDLYFRTLSKQTVEISQPSVVKSVESNNKKAIDSWIKNISALQKNKPVQSVNYPRAMPNIDSLMQVWPAEFEELLKEVSLPSPELNVDLNTYVDILCGLLDIPVYKSRIHSIHVLFTLFSEFKNSEHFKNATQTMNPYASTNFKANQAYDNKKGGKGADQLVIE